MEIFTTILTIIISTLSPIGLFVNNSLTKVIERQSEDIKAAEVRINAIPAHQLLQGKADSIQISLKQWQVRQDIVIELLELETDAVYLNLSELKNLKKMERDEWRKVFKAPLNAAGRIIVTEDDLNKIILSPQVKLMMTKLTKESNVEIKELNVDLQSNNRIRINTRAKLPIRGEELLNISLEFGLEVIKGHTLKIIDVQGTLNNRRLSSKLLQGFADNINTQLTLLKLEEYGVIARLIKLNIEDNQLEIAGFIHLENQERRSRDVACYVATNVLPL